MIVYSIFLFIFAALALLTGILMFLGKINSVYGDRIGTSGDYPHYVRAMGIATACLALPLAAGGLLFLFTPELLFGLIGIGVILLGIVVDYLAFRMIRGKYINDKK